MESNGRRVAVIGAGPFGLAAARAVAKRIIGIAFKENARLVADHPHIKRIVQKEITQHGAYHCPLRYPFLWLNQTAIG